MSEMETLAIRDRTVDSDTPIVSVEQPRRRRTSLIVIGGLVVVVAALVAAWLVASASETHRILVAGTDLQPGQLVTEADLRVSEVGGDLDMAHILANKQQLVVGRAPAEKVPAGTVLNESMFINADEVIPDGVVIVGAVLKAGQLPVSAVGPGSPVNLISTAEAEDGGGATLIGKGVVHTVQTTDSGDHWVSLLVPVSLELPVAAAAAAEELRLGVISG